MIQQPEIQAILCPLCRAANRPYARFCQQCGKDVLLDDTYRITQVIKEGGMGIVYQAVDADGAFYAIKEMHDRFTDAREREEGIQRFLEEAQLLRQLRGHPGIPQIYRSFIDEGRYYLAMEFVWGEDLEELLKRHGAFPEAQVLIWADELCDVLEHLHANGLIYRDMKPSNVMITHEGHVKVVDFGIAKLLQPGQRGTMIGTPGYSPPEQYQGITTVQSDIYALAATLHHLLTGRDPRNEPPFSFPPVRMLRPAISPQTEAALQRALALEVEKRFGSVAEFRRALPIPSGEQRPMPPVDVRPPAQPVPTQTFDPPPNARPAAPRAKAAPKPRAGRQYRQAWPVPPPQPLPTRAQQRRPAPAPRPRRTHRPARALRRIVAVVLLALGLYYGFQIYGTQIVSLIEQYLPALNQPLPDGGQPGGDADGAPATAQTRIITVVAPHRAAGPDRTNGARCHQEAVHASAGSLAPGVRCIVVLTHQPPGNGA
ncbi:serine/threonine-protein kinase [Kallotenue papyrolyticum]|uniref:serine/threonine-protein kinase n=1 Tax=Kallotenue papyrolyticum TaxID=1325125 RepID=UPI0023EC736C|nr:serine/threonine-protein kinase [Kallotenue papyrolyticum]